MTYVKTLDPYINTFFTYLFKNDCEPIIAAESENNQIEIDYINSEYKKIISKSECTIIDGDCGLFSPIAPNTRNSDLIRKLKVPVLIVTTPDENSVNNTLMTINTALANEIEIRGVVINNIPQHCDKVLLNSIPRIIEEFSNIKILGLVENLGKNPLPQDIITNILNGIDIESVFDVKIEKLDFE